MPKMRVFAVISFVCCLCYWSGATVEDQPIQTFVIPHSHMDVGWVYTVQVGFCGHTFIHFIYHHYIHLAYIVHPVATLKLASDS